MVATRRVTVLGLTTEDVSTRATERKAQWSKTLLRISIRALSITLSFDKFNLLFY
jgi:hypothetical protein